MTAIINIYSAVHVHHPIIFRDLDLSKVNFEQADKNDDCNNETMHVCMHETLQSRKRGFYSAFHVVETAKLGLRSLQRLLFS